MFDEAIFDKEIDGLIDGGRGEEAEEKMLKAYSALRADDNVQDLGYVVFRLAQYYSTPGTERLEKAEAYFTEGEVLSPGAYRKCQTALFCFYVLQDFQKTIKKVDEIEPSQDDRGSYYSALTLKGQALIKLGMLTDAGKVLDQLLSLIAVKPSGLPYGDEINLLEAAAPSRILAPKCKEILDLVIPKIRSQEYQARAKALLSLGGVGES